MNNRYIVIELCDNDLCHSDHTDYESALAYVNSTDNKAYIIRIEPDPYLSVWSTVVVEPHT
jgi:hypothetical protein